MSLIELLVQEGVLSKDKADALLKQAQQARQKAKEEAEKLIDAAGDRGIVDGRGIGSV